MDNKNNAYIKLLDTTVLNYCAEIDFDNEISLYDTLIKHFVNGDLDLYYENDSLNENNKKQVLDVVHKYQNYCFYKKNPEYWTESIFELPIEDYNLIAYQIIDNFSFLVDLFLKTGEAGLKLLGSYDDNEADDELTVVERARRSYINDDVLFSVFKKITEDNSSFSVFSDKQINILLHNAEGLLYFYADNEIVLANPIMLNYEILSRGISNYDENSNEEITCKRLVNEEDFNQSIDNMYFEYQSNIYINELLEDEAVKSISDDLSGEMTAKTWNIQVANSKAI